MRPKLELGRTLQRGSGATGGSQRETGAGTKSCSRLGVGRRNSRVGGGRYAAPQLQPRLLRSDNRQSWLPVPPGQPLQERAQGGGGFPRGISVWHPLAAGER